MNVLNYVWIKVAAMAKTVKLDYCELLAIEREEVWGRSAYQNRIECDLKPLEPGGRSDMNRAAEGVGESTTVSLEIGFA